jgi:hypothetical protein
LHEGSAREAKERIYYLMWQTPLPLIPSLQGRGKKTRKKDSSARGGERKQGRRIALPGEGKENKE